MAKVIDVDVSEERIEITYREPSSIVLTSMPPQMAPDKVWKEVYGVVDGKIQLVKRIDGRHEPAYTVREKFIFD